MTNNFLGNTKLEKKPTGFRKLAKTKLNMSHISPQMVSTGRECYVEPAAQMTGLKYQLSHQWDVQIRLQIIISMVNF